MAQVIKRTAKSGKISYLIRVSNGYGLDGKQKKLSMTWEPPAGMTEKRAEKEAQRQALAFEEQISSGTANDGRIRLKEFSERWMMEYVEKQLKKKTAHGYRQCLPRILDALGHIRLCDLKTGHINTLYSNLQEDGINAHTGGKLAVNSVLAHHRCLSSMLSKAVKWGYISYNPAANAELPRQQVQEAPYLDEKEVRSLLEHLQNEPIKYRAAITFDLLAGLRRGELLGMSWNAVDFENQTVTIQRMLNYTPEDGTYFDTPKNATSKRPLKVSRLALDLLGQLKHWQEEQAHRLESAWDNPDNLVFTNDYGGPIHPDTLTKWFTRFCKDAGFKQVHIHSLRHTCASLMIADGTPLVVVSRRLGHAQVSTTANIYSHVIASADEKAAQIGDRFADVVPAKPVEKRERTIA